MGAHKRRCPPFLPILAFGLCVLAAPAPRAQEQSRKPSQGQSQGQSQEPSQEQSQEPSQEQSQEPSQEQSQEPSQEQSDEYGTLNPEELTIAHHKRKLTLEPGVDINTCRLGYPIAKKGDTALARQIFERCAKAGIDAAFPWMSWLEENGYNLPGRAPERAAEWDRRSAERGYSIGQLNYGLDLLRGHGVARNETKGRAMIDSAAAQGNKEARTVIENQYDPYSVLPDLERPRAN